jgi:protein-tyrosine phosphatase
MRGPLVVASIRIHQVNFMSHISHPPTDSSYWVVPGKLLAGAYPGDLQAAAHERKIRALVDAGVRRFVSLMEVHETNYGGQSFVPYEELAQNMHPEVACVRFPIRDRWIPTVTEMRATLDAIDCFLDAQQTIYVHCWGGVGRTGTVVGCWLLRHGKATSADVLDKLTQMRRQDLERGERDSPENQMQREFVLKWREV